MAEDYADNFSTEKSGGSLYELMNKTTVDIAAFNSLAPEEKLKLAEAYRSRPQSRAKITRMLQNWSQRLLLSAFAPWAEESARASSKQRSLRLAREQQSGAAWAKPSLVDDRFGTNERRELVRAQRERFAVGPVALAHVDRGRGQRPGVPAAEPFERGPPPVDIRGDHSCRDHQATWCTGAAPSPRRRRAPPSRPATRQAPPPPPPAPPLVAARRAPPAPGVRSAAPALRELMRSQHKAAVEVHRVGWRAAIDEARASSDEAAVVTAIMTALRMEIGEKGGRGMRWLEWRFAGAKFIRLADFADIVASIDLDLEPEEVEAVFRFFDKDASGTISQDEFLLGMSPPLSNRRTQIVRGAFDKVDVDKSGTLTSADLKGVFDASQHPDALSGLKTEEQLLTEFLSTFEALGDGDGVVDFTEFCDYYRRVGALIEDDNFFELMIEKAWLTDANADASDAQQRRSAHETGGVGEGDEISLLLVHADGSCSIAQVPGDSDVHDTHAVMRGLAERGIKAIAYDVFGGTKSKFDTFKPTVWSEAMKQSQLCDSAQMQRMARKKQPPPIRVGYKQLHKLRTTVSARGPEGWDHLMHQFPADGGGLDLGQFLNCMRVVTMPFTVSETTQLFGYLSEDKRKTVTKGELIDAVRPPLTGARRELVEKLFSRLDKDGSGKVTVDDLRRSAAETGGGADGDDGFRRPEAETESAEAAVSDFIAKLQASSGGTVDSSVDVEELCAFYAEVSATMATDEAFERMLVTSWEHLLRDEVDHGGAPGPGERKERLLVRHADGHKSYHTIVLGRRGQPTNLTAAVRWNSVVPDAIGAVVASAGSGIGHWATSEKAKNEFAARWDIGGRYGSDRPPPPAPSAPPGAVPTKPRGYISPAGPAFSIAPNVSKDPLVAPPGRGSRKRFPEAQRSRVRLW